MEQWKTSCFSRGKGVFQGDTLSPLIFLPAFNPIIQSIQHASMGYKLKQLAPTCDRAPLLKVGTCIYTLWEKESSDSCGWCFTKILSIQPDDLASMKCRKGNTTEVVNLNDIKWTTASGSFRLHKTHKTTLLPINPHSLLLTEGERICRWSHSILIFRRRTQNHPLWSKPQMQRYMSRDQSRQVCLNGFRWSKLRWRRK